MGGHEERQSDGYLKEEQKEKRKQTKGQPPCYLNRPLGGVGFPQQHASVIPWRSRQSYLRGRKRSKSKEAKH